MSEDKTKEDNKKQADKDKPKINLSDSQMYAPNFNKDEED